MTIIKNLMKDLEGTIRTLEEIYDNNAWDYTTESIYCNTECKISTLIEDIKDDIAYLKTKNKKNR